MVFATCSRVQPADSSLASLQQPRLRQSKSKFVAFVIEKLYGSVAAPVLNPNEIEVVLEKLRAARVLSPVPTQITGQFRNVLMAIVRPSVSTVIVPSRPV